MKILGQIIWFETLFEFNWHQSTMVPFCSSNGVDHLHTLTIMNSVHIYPLDSLQGCPQTIIGVMELPVGRPKHTHTNKGKENPLVFSTRRVVLNVGCQRRFLTAGSRSGSPRCLAHHRTASPDPRVCQETQQLSLRSISTKTFHAKDLTPLTLPWHQRVFGCFCFMRLPSSRWPPLPLRRLSAKNKQGRVREVCGGGVSSCVRSHSRISCFGPWVSWVQSALVSGLIWDRNQMSDSLVYVTY